MAKIRPEPGMSLAHLLSVTRNSAVMELRFRLTPVSIARPPEDRAEHGVICAVCRRHVTWTVFSVAATKRRRRNWLLVALAGLLLLIAGIIVAAVAVSSQQFFQNDALLGAVATTVGIPGGIVCLAIGLSGWLVDQGVRVSDGSRGLRRYVRPVHSVRRPPRQKPKAVSRSADRGAQP